MTGNKNAIWSLLFSAGYEKEKIIKLAFAFEGKEVLIKRD